MALVLAVGCTAGSQPAPMCAPSSIDVQQAGASPGQAVVVTGQNFFRGCNDVGRNGHTPPMEPERGIRIELQQGSRSWTVGTVDAEADYSFEEAVEIPMDAVEGSGKIIVHGDDGPVEHHVDIL